MILANEAVAALLAGRGSEALYRVHERPDPQSLALARRQARRARGADAAGARAGLAHARAGRAARRPDRGARERSTSSAPAAAGRLFRRSSCARSSRPATTRATSATPVSRSRAYCHFTSPIRRYPDLVCHRALLRELGLGDDPLPGDMSSWPSTPRRVEREAAEVEYARRRHLPGLAARARARRSEGCGRALRRARSSALIDSGLFVRFGEVFEGFLPARRLGGDYFQLDPLGTALVGRRGGRYRLGDPIEVEVEKIERHSGKVELKQPGKVRTDFPRRSRAALSAPDNREKVRGLSPAVLSQR